MRTGNRSAGHLTWSRMHALLPLVLLLASCSGLDSLLDVSPPAEVDAEELERPENVDFLMAGLVGDFESAFGAYVSDAGTAGNELADATALNFDVLDRRNFTAAGFSNLFPSAVFQTLSLARWQAENALRLLDGWTDEEVAERTSKIATAAAYAGYSYVLLGEGMCTAAVDGGPELGRQELFQLAVDRFTRSLDVAQQSGNATIEGMVQVGRARALQNLGRLQDAATDAAAVPSGYVMNATYSEKASERRNPVFDRNAVNGLLTVQPEYRNVMTEGVPDPRIPVEDTGTLGFDGTTPIWAQLKYASLAAPIPLATWEEAQLILAEAALEAGQVSAAAALINDLRTRAGLPLFAGGDATEVRAQLLYERSAELFLESHHWGDLNRYGLPLLPAPGTVDDRGNTYGDQRCFPLPSTETRNNPHFP